YKKYLDGTPKIINSLGLLGWELFEINPVSSSIIHKDNYERQTPDSHYPAYDLNFNHFIYYFKRIL
ncbi:MAG TPA: hypothetical protein VK590_03060, partial [Saprospiraceae bacterium]|nr:hypothetical protein [Saprospiraceae bacterium]